MQVNYITFVRMQISITGCLWSYILVRQCLLAPGNVIVQVNMEPAKLQAFANPEILKLWRGHTVWFKLKIFTLWLGRWVAYLQLHSAASREPFPTITSKHKLFCVYIHAKTDSAQLHEWTQAWMEMKQDELAGGPYLFTACTRCKPRASVLNTSSIV